MNWSNLVPVVACAKKLKKFFRKKSAESLVRFKCVIGGFYVANPISLARGFILENGWFHKQIEKAKAENAKARAAGKDQKGAAKFVRCPGMHDLMHEGYLICLHTDLHIKANRMAVLVEAPHLNDLDRLRPVTMNYDVVEGLAPFRGDVKREVWKVPLPWGIYTEPGVSMHLMPALLHFPFQEHIFVYPGTVDYENFHTANIIFSVLADCDIVIPAGTPILQALPFKRVDFHAVSGPAEKLESDQLLYGFPSRLMGYYRKKFHFKKKYTIEVIK